VIRMNYIYYIAKRFFPNDLYEVGIGNLNLYEIVTLDSILCKKKVIMSIMINNEIGKTYKYEDIMDYDLDKNEQILKYCNLKNRLEHLSNIDNFEFCGYDILDYFKSNSWVTNYGLKRENSNNLYTQYGLINSFDNIEKWIDLNKHMSVELKNGEFELYAVWRKIKKCS